VKKLKVKDLHHDTVTTEFDRLTLIDLKSLLSNHEDFTHTGCPACLDVDVSFQFVHQELSYHRCNQCELLYISPAPSEAMHLDYVINSQAMEYWRKNTPDTMHKSRLPMYEERLEFVESWLKKESRIPKSSLEIGAGNGEFAALLAKSELNIKSITLLEPQELDITDPKISLIKGGFVELEESEQSFDVVFAWELIEHLLEPDNFLRVVKKSLKTGAPFIFSTPNEKSLETRLLQTASSNILFDHVRLYNPQAITKLLERNGFRVIDISTPGQLDVERLQNHMADNQGVFDNDPALKFILNNESEIGDSFQQYLCDNLNSSHMRVIAVSEGDWNGSKPPTL
jgi:2-polyprenyl-3-methyl-5-hydroxy-6-metoxy-1,4-benzoquinol methylase